MGSNHILILLKNPNVTQIMNLSKVIKAEKATFQEFYGLLLHEKLDEKTTLKIEL